MSDTPEDKTEDAPVSVEGESTAKMSTLDADAIAEALQSGRGVIKKCNVQYNRLDEAAKNALCDAVKGREGFELLV